MSILIPRITDIIDILIVAYLLYRLILLLKKAGGFQILIGLAVALIIYFTALILNLNMVSSVLKVFKDYWVIVFIILFQQEIRNLFARLAQSHNLKSLFSDAKKSVFSPLLNAISIMSFSKIGALIVIENSRELFIFHGNLLERLFGQSLCLRCYGSYPLPNMSCLIRQNRSVTISLFGYTYLTFVVSNFWNIIGCDAECPHFFGFGCIDRDDSCMWMSAAQYPGMEHVRQ